MVHLVAHTGRVIRKVVGPAPLVRIDGESSAKPRTDRSSVE